MYPLSWEVPLTRRERAERWLRRLRRLVVVLLVLGALEWWWWGDPTDHVAHAGQVAVPVQAFRNPMRAFGGVGFGPRLVLVGGGRCLGTLVGDDEVVLVWPSGTDVHGSGRELEVSYRGSTWRLGDGVDGASESEDLAVTGGFPGLAAGLPEACRDLPLTDVEPGR